MAKNHSIRNPLGLISMLTLEIRMIPSPRNQVTSKVNKGRDISIDIEGLFVKKINQDQTFFNCLILSLLFYCDTNLIHMLAK